MWIVLAMLSAGFAALTGIFAKLGMEGINSNLATAIPDPLRGGHGPELAVLFLRPPAGRGQ